ncbi:sugar phosphate isomerase/epimerase family protein [Glycomyces tritici]|uniref:Sugar phosphate isomerase/epimerase family protein n=1 Tax=Glycomyces tritici TaxID=2665176 RepID=A0ABT7YNS3_9ACTN|nr:sugar phosphate isomerase/epimerase family protein [Glycomyces tritici]MDN3240292.1 sugar phosphate isomerase/epimerase family protein [Glycomyces tritici]
MTRRIGVNTWVWASPLDDEALARLAVRVRDWGFDVIELPVESPGDWDPQRADALLKGLGLDATVVLVMGPGRELVDAPRAVVAETQEYLRRVVDAAVAVGSKVIAGPAYASVGRTWRLADRPAAYRELREHLKPVADYAAERGVTVAVEPLNRYETSLVNTVDQALEALDGLPGTALALDVYHMNIEETDIPAAIVRAGDRIGHVQVSGNDRGSPGSDHLPWAEILHALDLAGYAGPLVIESFTAHNATIATAASIWRPLAPTQDALAVDGLNYLRSLTDA